MSAPAPRPLAALSYESARRVRGVLFDVDDTVTRDGRLEPEAFAALWALHRAGLVLAAVTGRPLGWADVLARHWPVAVAVGENGAGWSWVAPDGAFHAAHFDPPEARAAAQAQLAEVRASVAAAFPDVAVATDQGARRCDLAFDVGETRVLPAARRDALVAHLEALGVRVTWSSVHVHAVPGRWDKARGVARALAAATGIDLDAEGAREAFVYVGDSPNDAPGFEAFPTSVGVANVRPHLPRLRVAPAFVTEADRGRGFAELAAHLLAARGTP